MASALILSETEYGLAEKAIFSEGLFSATPADVLARLAIVPTVVTIRKRGAQVSVEFQASDTPAPSFVASVERIAGLLTLPPGWNSYAAKPIAPASAKTAIRLVADLLQPSTPAPGVVPRVRGGIQLEWHLETVDIEIYIDSPDHVSFYAEDTESGESLEAPYWGNEVALKAWVQRIS